MVHIFTGLYKWNYEHMVFLQVWPQLSFTDSHIMEDLPSINVRLQHWPGQTQDTYGWHSLGQTKRVSVLSPRSYGIYCTYSGFWSKGKNRRSLTGRSLGVSKALLFLFFLVFCPFCMLCGAGVLQKKAS